MCIRDRPDIVCLQETKAQPDQIPTLEFEALGYRSFFFSAEKKGYSGVAILTRITPDHLEYGMGMQEYEMCIRDRLNQSDISWHTCHRLFVNHYMNRYNRKLQRNYYRYDHR